MVPPSLPKDVHNVEACRALNAAMEGVGWAAIAVWMTEVMDCAAVRRFDPIGIKLDPTAEGNQSLLSVYAEYFLMLGADVSGNVAEEGKVFNARHLLLVAALIPDS